MKKLISMLLVLVMVAAMATGCANAKPEQTDPVNVPASALEILENVWAQYADEEKFFCIGGDFGSPVENAPGNYNVADENFSFQLYIPAEQVANVDQAASLIHGMNANTFTGAAFHAKSGTDVNALATAIRDNVQNAQWMCGVPEKLIIVSDGSGYVVAAFGHGDAIDPFKTKLTEMGGAVVVEENIG